MAPLWQVDVIERRLASAGLDAVVMEHDLHGISGQERRAVLDAISAEGAGFPMALVDGVVVCHGTLDLDAVEAAVRERWAECGAEC